MDVSKLRVNGDKQSHPRLRGTEPNDGSGMNRMPDAVSKHVVEYFLKNAETMLFDTNNRTAAANARRSAAFRNLVAELKKMYGYDASEKKIRNHWDYVRSKAVSKGMASRKAVSKEKSYRMKTGGGRSLYEEKAFEESNTYPFDSSTEEAIWKFYDGTPAVQPFKEGESNVGRRNSIRPTESNVYGRIPLESGMNSGQVEDSYENEEIDVEYVGQEQVVPQMDEFLSDSGEGTDQSQHGQYAAEPPRRKRRNIRVTEADLLQQQYLLCQEQREFYETLQHTMHDMVSFIQMAKEEICKGGHGSREEHCGENPTAVMLGDPNLEESACSFSTV